jgi:hypothetical protein
MSNVKEPSGGIKFLVIILYIIGVILQAIITYYSVSQ